MVKSRRAVVKSRRAVVKIRRAVVMNCRAVVAGFLNRKLQGACYEVTES